LIEVSTKQFELSCYNAV